MNKSLDVIILFVLVIARVRIDTLADIFAFPFRHEDVERLVGDWWPAWSLQLLQHHETDPVSMMLIVTSFGLLGLYLIIDILSSEQQARAVHRLKLGLIFGIIILLVFAKTFLVVNLRQLRGPVSYAHDGGVIQTEVTVGYFLEGLNPYIEDYVDTPMAEWGYEEFRTALYHYPYLPWTFVFSSPVYLLSQSTLGWFDARLVYLPLFALTLLLVPLIVRRRQEQLIALAVIGLNPIGGISVIFGENDPFVMAWIVLGVWFLLPTPGQTAVNQRRLLLGTAAFGLACASKPTAWFLAPFWLLYLMRDTWGTQMIPPPTRWLHLLKTLWQRAWSLPLVMLLIVGPWFVWSPAAMYDDVWRWSSGQGESGYQIWGWGASNYVLAFGWVSDRFEYWPFIIPGAIIAVPLLIFLLWRQAKENTIGTMLYAYVVLLFAFFYVSRFMQPNYLGYILGFLALAMTIHDERRDNYVEREGSSARLRTTG